MTTLLARLSQALAGRYRIERELGAGGMATVFLADDLKHDRKVALKVLRPELAAVIGAERFIAEIKVTANLQHPHILPLHDSGEADKLLFYVMPYLEGESLRDLLQREKQLGIDSALRIASQVASALDYAHRHNVIHRDIKPENILLHDGQALVADFGIALALRAAGGDRLTETGLSLGTPQYMSPEQATADRELDARSDIYSLGCVLYEMLAGEAPHTGPTAQAIITKVVTEEPRPLEQQRRTVPAHVHAAVHKALEKLPADRFPSAAEFADALSKPHWASEAVVPLTAPRARFPSRTLARRVAWPALALLATAAAVWSWLRPGATPMQGVVARFVVTLPAHEQIAEAPGRLVAAAPDGSGFVYVGVGPNGRRLYWRPFDRFEARPIPGTEDAANPFFSPDGQWVGFNADRQMKKVALAGGPPTVLLDGTYSGASWGTDDQIVFSPNDRLALSKVSASGSEPVAVTSADTARGEVHAWPSLLPGGRHALFVGGSRGRAIGQIGVATLASGEVKYLTEGTFPRYAPSGHLIYATADGLRAAPFDLSRLQISGPAIPIQAKIRVTRGGVTDFDLSQSGTLVYLTGDDAERSLVTVDRQGREQVLTPELRAYDGPRFSPDGRRLAMRIFEGGFHIWTYELARGTFSRLTFEAPNYYPEWTPDGSRVAFVSDRAGSADLYWRRADGSGSSEPLLVADLAQWEVAWAPDGKSFVYRQNAPQTGRDLWMMNLGAEGETKPLLQTPHQERAPRISPDGRYLAYVSDESGPAETYVTTFPEPAGKWQISSGGGTEPLWSRDGRELFYRSGEQLVAATIQPQPVFTVGAREPLFAGPYVPNPMHTNYDIHPDGQRFVMVKSAEGERQVVVVINFLVELRSGK